MQALPITDTPVQIVHQAPASAQCGSGHTSAYRQGENAPEGCICAPVDLLAFAQCKPMSEVAQALGVSRATAHRIRGGYWPRDARAILVAWNTYKGRSAAQQSRWFLRRVQAGGMVLHAGQAYSAAGMAERVGETLACARSSAGLLAQTLELPSARFELLPAHAQA